MQIITGNDGWYYWKTLIMYADEIYTWTQHCNKNILYKTIVDKYKLDKTTQCSVNIFLIYERKKLNMAETPLIISINGNKKINMLIIII